MRRTSIFAPLALVSIMATGAGCSSASGTQGAPPNVTTVVSPSAAPSASPEPARSAGPGSKPPVAAASWPTPENCISYSPSKATVHYEAGIFIVEAGSVVVISVHGDPASDLGDKALALAKRYSKHCFLGRENTREEKERYIFDYWRNQVSGAKPVPGQEDDCSDYDRSNLTVDDMGNGDGWRVKDHDNVLHVFDTESDARNGKLVLSKYHRMCNLGDAEHEQISYQV
jgi:hypothetical protein